MVRTDCQVSSSALNPGASQDWYQMGATSNYALVIFLCPCSLASVFAFRLPQEMIKSAGQGYTLTLLFIYIPETSLHMPRVWPSYQTYIFKNFQLLLLDIKSAVTKLQARSFVSGLSPVLYRRIDRGLLLNHTESHLLPPEMTLRKVKSP